MSLNVFDSIARFFSSQVSNEEEPEPQYPFSFIHVNVNLSTHYTAKTKQKGKININTTDSEDTCISIGKDKICEHFDGCPFKKPRAIEKENENDQAA